ncbi:MAG: type I 3-dehydroquinate dehydratase [Prevotellaceae bacterium]|jgi:3-dehydroquinate dehydratase type I|nr:type I 3-dehydroquinate dehydratase [Prevotellaceae bacterium]
MLVEKVNDPRICVSMTTPNFADCYGIAQSCAMAELRLDLMQLKPEQVKQLLEHKELQTVATCRASKLDTSERLRQLQFAIRHGASYVDVEMESDESYRTALVKFAEEHGCKIIISYHNFEQTPCLPEMRKIIADCRRMNADIVKLVTTARSAHDSARVMSLYEGESNLVAFAMGNAGKITRIACLYLGAPFTYAAPACGLEAAPGQISARSMNFMIQQFENSTTQNPKT